MNLENSEFEDEYPHYAKLTKLEQKHIQEKIRSCSTFMKFYQISFGSKVIDDDRLKSLLNIAYGIRVKDEQYTFNPKFLRTVVVNVYGNEITALVGDDKEKIGSTVNAILIITKYINNLRSWNTKIGKEILLDKRLARELSSLLDDDLEG